MGGHGVTNKGFLTQLSWEEKNPFKPLMDDFLGGNLSGS